MKKNKEPKYNSTSPQIAMLAASTALLLFAIQSTMFANNDNIKKPDVIDTNLSTLGLTDYHNIIYNDFQGETSYLPMQYIKGSPVYYAISPNLSEEVSGYISEVMNEYTDLFRDINPDITFTQLPYSEALNYRIFGNKVIEYGAEDFDDNIYGINISTSRFNLLSSPNTVVTDYRINLDTAAIDAKCDDATLENWATTRSDQYKYVISHEMLHTLGMADVYATHKGEQYTKTFDYTTFINPCSSYTMTELSPVDYATLQALYTPLDLSIPENVEIINEKIAEYSDKFYSNLSKRVCEITQDTPTPYDYDKHAVDGKSVKYVNGSQRYQLDITNDKFQGSCKMPEFDQTFSGNVHYTEYGIVLDNVDIRTLHPFYTGEESYDRTRYYVILINQGDNVMAVQMNKLMCCGANITDINNEATNVDDTNSEQPKLATSLPDIVAGKMPDFASNIDLDDYIK